MIYTVTLNPAMDKTVVIGRFAPDAVNRVETMRTDPGGKGVNVSKVIARLGGQSVALALAAGRTGEAIEDALRMLRALSGAQHHVHTGVCIAFPGGEERFTVTTKVKFYPIEEAQLEAYAATGEPYDKAGAYAIQGLGGALVERYDGDLDTVVGLSMRIVNALLGEALEGADS